jgi:hypothetical protein
VTGIEDLQTTKMTRPAGLTGAKSPNPAKSKTDIRPKYDDRSWKQTDSQEENIAAKHKIRLTSKNKSFA